MRIGIILLLTILLMLGFACITSYEPLHDTQTFTVESLYAYELPYESCAHAEGILEGDFTITGGERDIWFYITNPHGYTVFGPNSFTGYGEFRLQTPYVGIYTLTFENWSYYDRYITVHVHGY